MLVMDSRADVPEHAQGRARQKARGLRNHTCTSDDCIYLDRKREDSGIARVQAMTVFT